MNLAVLVSTLLAILAWALVNGGIFYILFRKGGRSWIKKAGLAVVFLIVFILVTLGLFMLTRSHLAVQLFMVKGFSMAPTLVTYDFVAADALHRDFSRSDIIVYEQTENRTSIARIVGMPLERIEIKNGDVYINDAVLDETTYWSDESVTHGDMSITLRNNEYFVLGDNRGTAIDSRTRGPVLKENIRGKIFYKLPL